MIALLATAALLATFAGQPGPPPTLPAGVRDDVGIVEGVVNMASEKVKFERDALRWLWWPLIVYLFWCMGYICDEYFVRTIEVISERFQVPDDVAGATLMALGCNGPEMALNLISIVHKSDIGIGAVIGGEVFNVLVIIGTAILATPAVYMPLRLKPFSFLRDVFFYALSVGLLYWVLQNGSVSRLNSAVLIVGAVVYSTTVVFSEKIHDVLYSRCLELVGRALRGARRAKRHQHQRGVSADLSQSLFQLDAPEIPHSPSDPSGDSDTEALLEHWIAAGHCTEPAEGSVLSVRVEMRNRLLDRRHKTEERYLWLCADRLMVSTAQNPGQTEAMMGPTESVQYDYNDKTRAHHWHHGGLINPPSFLDQDGGLFSPGGGLSPSLSPILSPSLGPLINSKGGESPARPRMQSGGVGQRARVSSEGQQRQRASKGRGLPETAERLNLQDAPWETIPLEDILYCEPPRDPSHLVFTLHVHQHDSHLGRLITLELTANDEHVLEAWVQALSLRLKEQRREMAEGPPQQTVADLLMEWVEWFQFPVKWGLKVTIPDMDDPRKQGWYPVSFVMCMVWLALVAYSVIASCDGIHTDFGISTTVLGFTIAAAGTSLPNVFSGMIVSRQGRTSMAIANALGANIQNVFIALAIPWTIESCFITDGPFRLSVKNLQPAVLMCAITLMPVVLVFACCGCSFPRWSGSLFLATYVVYLVFALGQEITNCETWPFACG